MSDRNSDSTERGLLARSFKKFHAHEYVEESNFRLDRFSKMTHRTFESQGVSFDYFTEGKPDGPVMVTVHDIGQHSPLAFGRYFSCFYTRPLLEEFCIYHISLPGQYQPQVQLTTYPSLDSIASCIVAFVHSLKKLYNIGLGIGVGANLLIRASLMEPKTFGGLIFVNGYAQAMGWAEWLWQKYQFYNSQNSDAKSKEAVVNHLRRHFFGDDFYDDMACKLYMKHLKGIRDLHNLHLLLGAFASRSPIVLTRPQFPHGSQVKGSDFHRTLSTETLLIVSKCIPDYHECASLYCHLDPPLAEMVEFEGAHGMILDQIPERVTHSIILFLQGLGHLRGIGRPLYSSIGKEEDDDHAPAEEMLA